MFISEYLYDILKLCNKLKAGGNHTLVFAFYILCQMRDDVHSAGGAYLAARMWDIFERYFWIDVTDF